MTRRAFPSTLAAAIDKSKILGIRIGDDSHRFIGVWVVVVDGRVFIRSYTVEPDGWYRASLKDPRATLQVGTREVRARAVSVRSAKLRDAVDRAYAAKYPTPGSVKYVRGFKLAKRKATTTEFVPR